MSIEKVKSFVERMRTDEAFRKRILAVEGVEERLKAIKKEGYDCKLSDIQLYAHNYVDKSGKNVMILTEKGGCNGIYYGFCF